MQFMVAGGSNLQKNDLQRIKAVCQKNYKFVAYLTKVPREKNYQLRTLNLDHTCSRSYKNPRCTSLYIGKKLMKKVKRQPNMKLRNIQDAIHEKFTLNISARKASRAREKAREYVDGAYTQQYNQFWEYCEKLRKANPGNIILLKVHTFNEGDLATEMDMLESIRLFLITKFQENRQMIMNMQSEICPKVLKRLHKEKIACNQQIQKFFQHQLANRTSSTKLSHTICIIPIQHAQLQSKCTTSAMDKLF
nr:hypothetical protein CFP56_57793 [Quercus suber]